MEQTFRTIENNPTTDLENKINLWREASYAYYNSGETIMSDENFDSLSDYLKRQGVDLFEVGAPIVPGQERNHTFPMLSLGKVKCFGESISTTNLSDIINNLKRYTDNIVARTKILVTYKLDGCGIDLIYENGLLVDAITRGNGTTGKSVFKKMFRRLPVKLHSSFTGSLRGEFVMKKKVFVEKYAEEYANPRNLISGILSDQNLNDTRVDNVDLKLYSINGIWHINEKFGWECENDGTFNGIPDANIHIAMQYEIADLPSIYLEMRENRPSYEYPTDGFVIQLVDPSDEFKGDSHEPYHMIAVKFPPVKAITRVKYVELNLRKSGEYIPKLILDPVECDGSTVSRCAAYNWGYITEFGLFPGAKIEIGKNGDIIPYVQNVLECGSIDDCHIVTHVSENAEILPGSNGDKLPTGAYLIGVHLYKDSANSDKIKRERFIQQCYRMELKGFGWSAFNSLYDYVNGDFIELFNPINLQETMLMEVFPGTATRKKWINRINTLKDRMTLYWFIGMMSFPRCGWAMAKQVARKASHLDYDFSGLEKSVIENLFTGDYSKELGSAINRFRSYGGHIEPEKEEVTEYEATYEMTGVPNVGSFKTKEDVQKYLYKWQHTPLTKKTTYLITNDKNSKTNKMKKAEANGTVVITYAEAIELHRQKK